MVRAMNGAPSATLDDLARAAAAGPVVVAVLEAVRGSTPREAGAWMAVTAERTLGTIGGGEAERQTVEAARTLLYGGAPRRLTFPLGPTLDQCCGGHMTVALAPLGRVPAGPFELFDGGPVVTDRPRRPVIVYGAGHVGAALVTALAPLPFSISWVDARAEALWEAPAPFPCRRVAIPEGVAAAAPDDAFHVVMTHSHALDLEIVAAVLARPFGYLGLIGSATKRATFERRLAERGLSAEHLTCPIGLAMVRGKEPAVIAASVAAQLVAVDRAPAPMPVLEAAR
jgi:xanthine dehydrogenase accessory protein XdhC